MFGNLVTLGLLVLLQAVLGFDNLLYISLESKRVPVGDRRRVRAWGIGLAIFLRIALLFSLTRLIDLFQNHRMPIHLGRILGTEVFSGEFNLHSGIVILGGVFIIYTAVKEIWHMMNLDHSSTEGEDSTQSSARVVTRIVLMNIVFSFDSILSAMALTDVFWVMAAAIILSGLMMIILADSVASFLERNRMYEVLGLFVLFIVGIMLLGEGGHLAGMSLFGHHITPMSKGTFYFALSVLVLTEIVQTRYQRKLSS